MSSESPQKAVIFLHIPKAAGSTLHDIIERQYSPKLVYSVTGNQVPESVAQFRALPESERQNLKMVKGHMGFGLHELLPQGATYFTLLRHPVDRVLSHYYYILRRPNHYLYETVTEQNMSLQDFAIRKPSLELDNGQTRLIAGKHGEPDRSIEIGQCTPEMLEDAKQNLRNFFTVVGITEEFDRALILLKRTFGWRNVFYTKRRVTHNRPQEKQIDIETRRIIEQCNALDMELYEYSKKMFQESLQNQNASFGDEVKQFKQFNQSYYGKFYSIATHGLNKVKMKLLAN